MLIEEKITNLVGKGKCITERHEKDVEFSKKKLVCEKKKNASGEYDYILEGIVASADEDHDNGNGRRYGLQDMIDAVARYKENFVDKKLAFAELSHPNSAEIDLDRVSHLITDIWMEGKDVYAKMILLDLPITKVIKEMLRVGSPIGISSRIVGDLIDMGDHTLVENFDIVCFDIVSTPSNSTSWLDGVLQEKEYVMDKNGLVMESKLYTQKVMSNVTKSNAEPKFKYLDELFK